MSERIFSGFYECSVLSRQTQFGIDRSRKVCSPLTPRRRNSAAPRQ
jgi:hypothetical protein